MRIRFIARIKIEIPKSMPPWLRKGIDFIYRVDLGRRIPKIAERRYVPADLENPSNPGVERSRGQVEQRAALRINIKKIPLKNRVSRGFHFFNRVLIS